MTLIELKTIGQFIFLISVYYISDVLNTLLA